MSCIKVFKFIYPLHIHCHTTHWGFKCPLTAIHFSVWGCVLTRVEKPKHVKLFDIIA